MTDQFQNLHAEIDKLEKQLDKMPSKRDWIAGWIATTAVVIIAIVLIFWK